MKYRFMCIVGMRDRESMRDKKHESLVIGF